MRRAIFVLIGILVIIGVAAVDLWRPRRTDLRAFDPHEVARLETDMWRSYYAMQRGALFRQMSQLLRTQYGETFVRSYADAFHAARAAFLFKEGRNRADYEKALPDLIAYYASIRRGSASAFDPQDAARLELEWWIVHRERDRYGQEPLERSLADLQAAIYQVPVDRLREHAAARAQAMLLRDGWAANGSVTPAEWEQIRALLDQSWTSLWRAVQRQR